METLSFSEYNNETNRYTLSQNLADIGIPKNYFVRAAISIAKSVQHLVKKEYKIGSLQCLEIAEKYLRGEATTQECQEIAQKHWRTINSPSSPAAYAYASAASAASAVSVDAAAYAATATAYAAAAAAYAAAAASDASPASAASISADLFREHFLWNLVCGFQIAKVLEKSEDERFVEVLLENQQLIQYATIILEDQNLKEEFEFLMKNYKLH